MLSAFAGEDRRKQAAVARARRHVEANETVPGPFFWDGRRGSLLGVVTHGSDPAGIETGFAIAAQLLPALERWWKAAYHAAPLHVAPWDLLDPAEVAAARRFPYAWLAAIPPGGDTVPVASALLLRILDDTLARAAGAEEAAELVEILGALRDRHAAAGDTGSGDWRRLRRRAVALRDAAPAGTPHAAIAAVTETAAWPLDAAGTLLADVLEAFVSIAVADARAAAGWTAADEARRDSLAGQLDAAFAHHAGIVDDDARMAAMGRARRGFDEAVDIAHPGFRAHRAAADDAAGLARWRALFALMTGILAMLRACPVAAAAPIDHPASPKEHP